MGLCALTFGLMFSGAALADCRTVQIQRVRMASVQLFDLAGVQRQTVPRDALGGVSEATECTEDQRFLMISLNNQNYLVRREALALPGTITRPLCPCPSLIASASDRRAADPGVGDQICDPNPSCTGAGGQMSTPAPRVASPADRR